MVIKKESGHKKTITGQVIQGPTRSSGTSIKEKRGQGPIKLQVVNGMMIRKVNKNAMTEN